MKVKKTNAARILDELGIAYTLKEYKVDEEHLDALFVADEVGMPADQVFKTLCARGDKNGILFGVIKGNGELNLKALAKASGNKRVEMVHLKEVQPLTGYIRGGVRQKKKKKEYPVYLDSTAAKWPQTAVSAGHRGLQIIIAPADLLKATRGSYFDNEQI